MMPMLRHKGFPPIETWSSCYYHPTWKRRISVYVDDFNMSGPEQYLDIAWTQLPTHIEMEEPVPAGLCWGYTRSCTISIVDYGVVKKVLCGMHKYFISSAEL